MADFERPKEGFRFRNGGIKTNAEPDNLPPDKYTVLQNIRSITDSSIRTRPGMVQQSATNGTTVTDLRNYSALGTDDAPRTIIRTASDSLYLDNGDLVGTLFNASPISPGAALIPFRPAESPSPYMYVANGSDYQKVSAPASGHTTMSKVGIIEPQSPPDAGISAENISYVGEPAGGAFTLGGTASSFTIGNRIADSVQGAFPDPNGTGFITLQVAGGAGLPAGIYLASSVLAYFWPRLAGENGAFGRPFPLSTSTAVATSSGNSLMFNPQAFNGTADPNVQPLEWAILDVNGNITGYKQPWSGATEVYDMAVVCSLFFPAPGTYTITINHDDGMFFAIQGATLLSGPVSDPYNHIQTAINGYKFANGGIRGNNTSGNHGDTFVISVPASGVYAMEIDFSQWTSNQQLVVFSGVTTRIFQATGISSYQKGMVITVNGELVKVQDVYAPLPQSIPIAGIAYLSGTTGKCIVVPSQLGSGPGVDDASIYETSWVASLRRGALVQIGSEVCFVLSVSSGPNGTVSFETSTVSAHTTADSLQGIPAISVLGGNTAMGSAIASPDVQFSVAGTGSGIGTCNFPTPINPFSAANAQPQDLVHVSINVDNLSDLDEMKLLFDVGDGSFTQNFYYYTIRPNDIALGVSNGLTQLGVAQLVSQRAAIDDEQSAERNNQGVTKSSAQSAIGSSQWSEITFAITDMTRVGNDQSKTLQNTNAGQLLINANAVLNIAFNSITISGGYSGDVGESGAPYLYRVRPRSSITGAKGNPSPATRYGTNPRRQQVTVLLPTTGGDPQIDTWDIFRYGGTITSWRRIGFVPAAFNATFIDNYADDAAAGGELLEFDNFQPWPSIDIPLNVTATQVCGTLALVTIPSPTNALRYLPGNQVRLGGQTAYTLWTRPVLVTGTTYRFRFLENAGAATNLPLSIYEPTLAQQRLPYMWGPDADGTVFACGDPLRLGTVYESKENNPDAAPDRYNQEITPPSEPLMGGETIDGVPYVASTERWWRLYFQSNGAQRYSAVQQQMTRGLAAPYGHCNDGSAIYWWAKDGIQASDEGSLTDADLFNLFPHEGVAGIPITYGGFTFTPPDYSRAGTFRLAYGNGYLYATYQDSAGNYHNLVYDKRRKAWQVDVYATPVSVVYHPEQQAGTLLSNTSLYAGLLLGTTNGLVAVQTDNANDLGTPIPCAVGTMEWNGGDARAGEQWGDMWVDLIPRASAGVSVSPMSDGILASPIVTVPTSPTRIQTPISLGGSLTLDFLGILLQWTDDFSIQSKPTVLLVWQPSFLVKPEMTEDRITDWYDAGDEDHAAPAAWWQGFILHADTDGDPKGIAIRDSDSLTLHSFTPIVNHNGEQMKAYSFDTPFIAHSVRIEPTDLVPWRMFDVEWVTQPTPEIAETWQTQGTSFEMKGYSHIQRIVAAYASTVPITLTITSFDGTSPAPITLPSTNGAYQKLLVVLTFNKGQLYFFKSSGSVPYQLYWKDFEILVGNWGRDSAYLNYNSIGGDRGDRAAI